jgi:hypothetical protein
MQPVATCCSTIELHNNFWQLCVPLLLIFTCVAHKLAPINSSDPPLEKFGLPCCRYSILKAQNLYKNNNVTYFLTESFTAMLMMNEVFWDVIVCFINSYWHFGRGLCLHLQGQSVQEKSTAVLKPYRTGLTGNPTEKVFCLILYDWGWKQNQPPKHSNI